MVSLKGFGNSKADVVVIDLNIYAKIDGIKTMYQRGQTLISDLSW